MDAKDKKENLLSACLKLKDFAQINQKKQWYKDQESIPMLTMEIMINQKIIGESMKNTEDDNDSKEICVFCINV